jgi:hypothetical protein
VGVVEKAIGEYIKTEIIRGYGVAIISLFKKLKAT